MICFPNAKINIGLNITEKRADGFHTIESVMYPLKGIVYDALEIIHRIPSPSLKENGRNSTELIISGISIPGNTEDNLCVKAYHLIKKEYHLPSLKIHLHKTIPIGAGLGGGSADAAFFIRLLNDTFELGISWGKMHHYARQLGSDCSFFISNKPAFAEGKGDDIVSLKLNLSGYYFALVYPGIHVSTAQAYANFSIPNTRNGRVNSRSLEEDVLNLPVEKWKKYIRNNFEDSIFLQFPKLKKIKEKLYSLGAVYASMSGSGSAVYGIFEKEPKVKKQFLKYKVWEEKLG